MYRYTLYMYSPKVQLTNSFNYHQYCMVWPQIAEKMQIQIWCGLEGIACGGVFSNKIAWVALLFWPQVYDSFRCGVLDGNTTG